jgi:hypothetical protein
MYNDSMDSFINSLATFGISPYTRTFIAFDLLTVIWFLCLALKFKKDSNK